MDFELLSLIAMVAATIVLSSRHGLRMRARPGRQYHGVFSLGLIGVLYLVSGLVGLDLSRLRGVFAGSRWVAGPVWWQIGLGTSLLLIAGILARRAWSRPVLR
jgi:hypothetical protein